MDLCSLSEGQFQKFSKIIKRKAPIALEIAERLIDNAAGCESELKELNKVFTSKDALLGLTSIGKQVDFIGQ